MVPDLDDLFDDLQLLLGEYVDIDFPWVSWVLMPLVVTFMLPLVILALFYMTAVILYIYKLHRQRILDAYETDIWDGARKTVAALWDAHGWIWHGYELQGADNIPDDSAALVVYYHGAIPVDLYYFMSRLYLTRNRLVHTVADRFLFSIPGWGIISEVLKVIPGTIQTCSTLLREGNLLAISPGGVYEAQFGDSRYRLMWKKRLGFAKVAIDAQVPIIPMFTENVREAFRTLGFGRRLWTRLYLWTRLPIVPIYGGFPVKLVTHIGPPIPFEPGITPEELQKKVAAAIEELIERHQSLPGSILRGITQRVVPSSWSSKKSEAPKRD